MNQSRAMSSLDIGVGFVRGLVSIHHSFNYFYSKCFCSWSIIYIFAAVIWTLPLLQPHVMLDHGNQGGCRNISTIDHLL